MTTTAPAEGQVRPCFLYYFLDADDRVLYVGMTDDFETRRKAHSRKAWFIQVANEIVMTYPDRITCAAVEALVIHALRPPMNTAVPTGARCSALSTRALDEVPLAVDVVKRIGELQRDLKEAKERVLGLADQLVQAREDRRDAVGRARWAEAEIERSWQAYLRPAMRHQIGEWIWSQLGRVAYVDELAVDRESALRSIAEQLTGRRAGDMTAGQPLNQPMLPIDEFLANDATACLHDLGIDVTSPEAFDVSVTASDERFAPHRFDGAR